MPLFKLHHLIDDTASAILKSNSSSISKPSILEILKPKQLLGSYVFPLLLKISFLTSFSKYFTFVNLKAGLPSQTSGQS